jgi:hypothetical protein
LLSRSAGSNLETSHITLWDANFGLTLRFPATLNVTAVVE